MLSNKKKKMGEQMKENMLYCAKCDAEMKEVLLPRYEYEMGYPLHNVAAYSCPECGKAFFTENQAKEMQTRTEELKEYTFGFERKITLSGKSLVIGIPHELAEHLKMKQGEKVRIFPIANEGFMIRKLPT